MNDINTVAPNAATLKNFIPSQQLAFMARLTTGEEGEYFIEKFATMAAYVNNMPKTYETDGVDINEKIITLHYFYANMDWYIIEKDMEGEEAQYQAFGLADIGFGLSGLGYISIDEIINMRGTEIDLHWTPCTVAAMKAKRSN